MAGRAFRIVGRALLFLALALVAGVGVLHGLSRAQITRRHSVPEPTVSARTDSVAIARGDHLYHAITCATCHGDDGGGAVYEDAGPIGFLAGPNLTSGRGGVAASRSDADWVRAIRHGVRQDSTSMLVMPSEVFTHLNDSDLGAILGYLRQLPPVDRDIPPSDFRFMGRLLHGAGKLDILVAHKTPTSAPRPEIGEAPSVEYGKYLADVSGCHGCHGYGLSGGPVAGPPGLPPASNLTPTGLEGWSEEAFVTVMRTGQRPDGTTLHEFMPWKAFRNMNDVELTALWRYLQSVPPRVFGGK